MTNFTLQFQFRYTAQRFRIATTYISEPPSVVQGGIYRKYLAGRRSTATTGLVSHRSERRPSRFPNLSFVRPVVAAETGWLI